MHSYSSPQQRQRSLAIHWFTTSKQLSEMPKQLLSLRAMTNETDATNAPGDQPERGQLMAPGHSAGDFVEAYKWQILEEAPGLVAVQAHLPDHLKNPQGQLFGGFTPTYVDLISLFAVHAGSDKDPASPRSWLTTINMRCDYFEPIVDETFVVRGEVVNQRGLTSLVSAKFYQGDTMAAHAVTTIRELPNITPNS